jgi:hypothetical protein
MEGFSTPRSTKRTAGSPSSHPIGPWSHCSAPPGSLPLRPHQAPALHGTAGSTFQQDPHTLGPPTLGFHVGTAKSRPRRDPGPLGTSYPWDHRIPTLGPTGPQLQVGSPDPCPAGIPSTQAHRPSGPAQPQFHVGLPDQRLAGSPPFRPCKASAPCGMVGSLPHHLPHP